MVQSSVPGIPVYALAEAMDVIFPASVSHSGSNIHNNFTHFFDVQYIDPKVI